ncbi:hypothetical protein J0A68_03840 [Algoriphagus sp. H41]|uniref:Uncharacterized protein n=1 Tax=Algoriphagus oliviformis TaxID=2811231 RepID=A0ABS3BYY9_9BACT|nr:hypothetical protein [Algoriphagus oliviformis]MBN7810073.1 hypothetical protein [Algoriphagus oliviformis]
MLKFSGFHFKKPVLLSAAVLGLALIAVDASAQSETEKVEENNPKGNDRVILEDNSLLQDNISSHINASKTANTVKAINTNPVVKRDLPAGGVVVDKDPKKIESPSTLSFNIFLYIVDKFKAD